MCCRPMHRRNFLGLTTGMLAGAGLGGQRLASASWAADTWDPDRPFEASGRPLRVQPILMYAVPQRRDMASWKSWGGVQTEAAAAEEAARIARELADLEAGFPLTVLPVAKVKSPEEAARARTSDHDVLVVYPATGSGALLRASMSEGSSTIIFVRHRSGPVYYWYEALSVKYLKTDAELEAGIVPEGTSVQDVVVDDPQELLWRLRSFHAVKDFLGSRIVALGGPGGKYAPEAPQKAKERHRIEIIDVGYDEFSRRIEGALADPALRGKAEGWTERYLSQPRTTLATEKRFVVNAFLLYGLFKDLLRERDARILTINSCMGTIIPMSQTTACLTLSLLNDEGLLAFCESDFVIIPPGIFLHALTRKPVFLHNSTFPHGGVVTCAHCTSPRRMDGERYEPASIVTHYESEFGAAPKVDMPVGQEVTFIDPEYATGRWIGIQGKVEGNPSYEICRSQQDVRLAGDWKRLLSEARDSHWVMAYGDWLREIGYAARRIGVRWESISAT